MSNYLHEIIHSLTQNEKRYFKLHSEFMFPRDEKRYSQLFELTLKQKVADDDVLRKLIGGKHFAQLKQQLYNKILDSLRAFHAGNSIRSIIDEYLADYRILVKKKLLKQAYKSIKKAELLALNYEMYPDLISIKQSETELLVLEGDAEKLGSHIGELRRQMPQWMQLTDQTLQIEKEYINFVKLNRENEFIRSAAEQKTLDEFVEAPVLKHKIRTLKGKTYYYYIMGLYQFFSGRFDKSLSAFEEQLNVFENHPHISKEFTNEHAKVLANVCLLCNKTGNNLKFNYSLQALQTLVPGADILKEQITYWNYLLQLNRHVSLLELEEAELFIKKHESKLSEIKQNESFAKMMSTEMNYVMFDTVFVYMCRQQFSKANKIVYQYLNNEGSQIRSDHYHLARIVHLFIQLELDNDDYVENELRTLSRYLKEHHRLFEFERRTLNHISEIINEKSKKTKLIWKKYRENLGSLSKQRYEGNAMFSFNFIYWAQMKSME